MIWTEDNSYSLSVSAFTDSVDGGTYSTGICGEKRVTLDAGSPAFLTVVADSVDPILNPFQLQYDAS